ncbi:MAG: choice-of-anchor D domain-containing protein [Candidatus Kapaibacteriota bacterium]
MHYLRIFIFIVALAATVLWQPNAVAQVQVVGVSFPGGSDLDLSAYPKVRVRCRVTNNQQPLTISSTNVILIQSNTALRPATVTQEGGGIHVIEWVNSQFDSFLVDLLITHQGQTAALSYRRPLSRSVGANVVFRDSLSRNLPGYADFESIPVGRSDTMKLKVVATEAALQNGQERMITIDSVTSNHPDIAVVWKGSFRTGQPPVMVISPLEYRIDVICTPVNADPISGVISVYYEGGMRRTLMVVANPRTYPQRTILQITAPNGGESFAPCQEIPIRWKGAIPGFYSFVEFTPDNGRSWVAIDSTLDSTYLWEVPVTFTDSARIRVSQKFQASEPRWLSGPEASASTAAYSRTGEYLLVAYSDGTINEWNVATGQQTGSYRTSLNPGEVVAAVTYVGTTRDLVISTGQPGRRGGRLLRFSQAVEDPQQAVDLPSDILVQALASTSDGATIYVLPQQTARVARYSTGNLQESTPITLATPIASSSVAGSRFTLALLDGTVSIYNVDTGAEERTANSGLLEAVGPYVYRVASSADGRLAGLAGKRRTDIANGAKEQRTFVFDMEAQSIVKIIYRETSEAVSLSFTPSNTFMAMGFEYSPQFVVYDMAQATVLPPTGSAAGHQNRVTYLAFSPDGSTLVSTSIDSTRNALLRRVSAPETDLSDNVFRIAPVELSVNPLQIADALIGEETITIFSAEVCNTGSVPAIIRSSYMLDGSWVRITNNVNGDTVLPGACLTVELTSVPADTGQLRDTMVLEFCGRTYFIPVEQLSIDRNLSLLISDEDFGDVCVGQQQVRTLAMLRNNDPVELVINTVFVERGLLAQFRVLNLVPDTVIPPGGTLVLDVEFAPRRLGADSAKVVIRYANQRSIERTIRLQGRGSGADLQLSHLVLPFIPEIPNRDVVLRNRSDNPLTITEATIAGSEPVTVLTPLPIVIGPRDSVVITLQYSGGTISDAAEVVFAVEPCAASTKIRLANYRGTATLSAPTVTAPPRGDTTALPIMATITEQQAYAGERFLEATLTVDERLYLARDITTTAGVAQILSQDVRNGLRFITFRVTGRFSGTMEIARLVGYAGMAEIDQSPLDFDSAATGFGTTVPMTYVPGVLRIQHDDPVRRIKRATAPTIVQITPQPATDDVTLVLDVPTDASVILRVLDATGRDVKIQNPGINPGISASGTYSMRMDTSDLVPGTYRVVVSSPDGLSSTPMVIVR